MDQPTARPLVFGNATGQLPERYANLGGVGDKKLSRLPQERAQSATVAGILRKVDGFPLCNGVGRKLPAVGHLETDIGVVVGFWDGQPC